MSAKNTDYNKCYSILDNGVLYNILYNPKEKDASKAYIKVEAK